MFRVVMMMEKELKEGVGYIRPQMARLITRLNVVSANGARAGKRTPWASAMVAKLRRAVGSEPGA